MNYNDGKWFVYHFTIEYHMDNKNIKDLSRFIILVNWSNSTQEHKNYSNFRKEKRIKQKKTT